MQLKHHLPTFLCIATFVVCGSQTCRSQSATKDYLASIPPDGRVSDHAVIEGKIKQWLTNKGITFDEKKDVFQHSDRDNPKDSTKKIKQSHGHLLRLQFTADQAKSFQADFGNSVFFGPDHDFEFLQIAEPEFVHDSKNKGTMHGLTWVPITMSAATITVNKDTAGADHTPVIYFVDSGVQWIVNGAGAIHQQFSSPRIQFLNGRTPSSVGSWPPTIGPWKDIDTLIPAGTLPYSGSLLDPNKDPIVHGTKVASAAVGSFSDPASLFGKIAGSTTVAVESIRVYPATGSPTSLNIADGIYEAIDAHLWRSDTLGYNARSILVLASRSTSGFTVNVEVALLDAWRQGMIVLCASGDSATPYVSPSKASPNAQWFINGSGALPTPQPTSPSRFDVDLATTHPEYWPVYYNESGGVMPAPTAADRAYAILVAGNNTTSTQLAYPYTDQWGATSSAKGPDVDIVVPTQGVPCATTTSTSSMSNTSGTSFSVGLVAGLAAIFLDHNVQGTTPQQFRDWLLPTTSASPSTRPWKITGSCTGWYYSTNASADNSWYLMAPFSTYTGGNVPKVSIDTLTDWTAP